MHQARTELVLRTEGQGLLEITERVARWAGEQGMSQGLLTLFLHHTSASLLIQENADTDMRRDLEDFFRHLAPQDRAYRHGSEGPDDMPAHLRTALTSVHLAIPVTRGRLDLGAWQGIYLFEHRARPHQRRITLHLIGE